LWNAQFEFEVSLVYSTAHNPVFLASPFQKEHNPIAQLGKAARGHKLLSMKRHLQYPFLISPIGFRDIEEVGYSQIHNHAKSKFRRHTESEQEIGDPTHREAAIDCRDRVHGKEGRLWASISSRTIGNGTELTVPHFRRQS